MTASTAAVPVFAAPRVSSRTSGLAIAVGSALAFSSSGPQTAKANRPPGSSHLATLANADGGSEKNIVPKREAMRS